MLRKEGMGLIEELTQLQETYRGLVQEALKDHPATGGLDEDNIISVCCVFFEMRGEAFAPGMDNPPENNDVMWAIEFLDHLDTLGKEILPKWVNPSLMQNDEDMKPSPSPRRWPGQPNSG